VPSGARKNGLVPGVVRERLPAICFADSSDLRIGQNLVRATSADPAPNLDSSLRYALTTELGWSIGIVAHKFAATFRPRRQTCTVPSATQSLDQ
jgi:hypothetical protein